jgi:putative transposase
VSVVLHREIPKDAIISYVSLTVDSTKRWFVTLTLEAPRSAFEKKYTSTGVVGGIDPGIKTALTVSDGAILTPPKLSKNHSLERQYKKLSRKLDRQTRQNNPHCFDAKGQWIRGRKINSRTKGMQETALKIAHILKHFKNVRKEFYHLAAIQLLNQFDFLGIGDGNMVHLARGRGQNRTTREHAISTFKQIISDKANLSMSPKAILEINERNTSRTCNNCKFIWDGLTLEHREWTCPKCSAFLDRDVNAAKNIADLTQKQILAKSQMAAAQAVEA